MQISIPVLVATLFIVYLGVYRELLNSQESSCELQDKMTHVTRLGHSIILSLAMNALPRLIHFIVILVVLSISNTNPKGALSSRAELNSDQVCYFPGTPNLRTGPCGNEGI